MNEQKIMLAILSLVLILISCKETVKKNEIKGDNIAENGLTKLRENFLVDYKKDTYKISIGDNYKTSDRIIDWRWAAESDGDRKIDSTGKDAYLYLGEPLINYNNGQWLPSLYIETDRNMISSFTCSILFNLSDKADAETEFLRLLSKDIKRLLKREVIKSLIDKGFYEKETQGYLETFRLTKGNHDYNRFEYTVK